MDKNNQLIKLAKAGGTDAHLVVLDEVNALEGKVNDLDSKVDTKIEEVKNLIVKAETNNALKAIDLVHIPKIIGKKGDKGDTGEPGKDGIDGRDGIDGTNGVDGQVIQGIDGKDGTNGKDGVDGVNGTNGTDGKDGSPDTPLLIRDKLETLKGDDRLDKTSIKGLENVIEQSNLDRAVSILDSRTSFLINKVSNLAATIPSSGSGTVTSVSVSTANGVSGSVATATTTPAITLTLGAITPTSVTTPQTINTSNAIAASGNAATVPITSKINTVTNNSAATLTITLTTASAVDGQLSQVRVLDFSGVAQTITWVNTENGEGTAPTTSNGSTTLPRAALFQFNGSTSKWRCLAS